MIQIVTGKLGAGKTLFSVMLLFDALCAGRTVCTNIAVDWAEIERLARKLKRRVLDPAQLVKIDPQTDRNWQESIPFGRPGAFVEVFLDEIHLFFNARDWAKTNADSKGLLSFLTQSRKAAVNVTFIAQEITTIEKQFRCLAEWELYVFSSDHIPLGFLGKCPFKFFIVSQLDAKSGLLLKKTLRGYNKAFFRLYGSFTFLDSEMQELSSKAVYVEPYKLCKIGLGRWCWESFRDLFKPLFARSK